MRLDQGSDGPARTHPIAALFRPCRRVAPAALLLLLALVAVQPRSAVGGDGGAEPTRLGEGEGPPADGGDAGPPAPRFPDAAPRYHNPETLVCADCHLAGGESGSTTTQAAPAAPNPAFLRFSDPLDLCLSCHDGRISVPDVVGEDANGLADRSAGFFGPPDAPSQRGHALGHGLATPGERQGPGEKVTCIDCHAPHGNHVARNLRWAGGLAATPPLGLFVDPAAAGMRRYESACVSYGTLDSDELREVSSVCVGCHPAMSGAHNVEAPGGGFGRHPSYDSARGSTNDIARGEARGTTVPSHWERGYGSGFDGTGRVRVVVRGASDYSGGCAIDARRNGVFCLSCHKAHGSGQPFGLAWPAERGLTATGCDQCHMVAGESPPALAGNLR